MKNLEFAIGRWVCFIFIRKVIYLLIITFNPLSYFINKKSTFCCIFEKSGAETCERQEIFTYRYQLGQFQSIRSISVNYIYLMFSSKYR